VSALEVIAGIASGAAFSNAVWNGILLHRLAELTKRVAELEKPEVPRFLQ